MTVIVLLVIATGVAAYGYQQGWLWQPADDVTVGALPTCPPPTPHALTAADVHVNVYNSTSRDGLASTVATALGKRSFAVETVANDPLNAHVTGTALIRYGSSGVEAAKLVTAQVPKATMRRDKRKGTTVDLVLGEAFRQLAPAAAPTTTAISAGPTPTPTCTPASTPADTPTSPASGTPSTTG
jgi:LytR cell envelope-related transcriptional attenuator